MKKIFVFLLTAAMMLALTACAEPAPETTEAPTDAAQTTAASEATAAADSVDLQALYDSMAAQMPEMIVLDESMMLNFCGIAAEDCTQVIAAICADGLRTDELWLIEAVDEAALDRLKSLAETRLKAKGEESISYSPEQYAVVEKAQIITSGLYLAVIVSPDVDVLADTCNGVIGA